MSSFYDKKTPNSSEEEHREKKKKYNNSNGEDVGKDLRQIANDNRNLLRLCHSTWPSLT